MADVKHDPVTFADWPLIQEFGFDDRKQCVSDLARIDQTLHERVMWGGVAIHFAGSPCGGRTERLSPLAEAMPRRKRVGRSWGVEARQALASPGRRLRPAAG